MYPTGTDQPLWYAPYQYRSALMICSLPIQISPSVMLPVHSDKPSWYAHYPLIPIRPYSMPPIDSYQPLWYARQSTDSDKPLLHFSLFISISPYDMPPTDSDQLLWYAPQPVPISPSVTPPFQCDQPPMLCPLPTPISPSDISPTDADQPLWYIPYRCRSAPLICLPTNTICLYDMPLPMPIRSSPSDFLSRPRLSAPMICPYPFRSARPHANFVNLRWTSKHTIRSTYIY